MYGSKQGRLDEVPMNDIGPGYAPIDEQRNHRNKPPVGGVALFPNLPPVSIEDLERSHIFVNEPKEICKSRILLISMEQRNFF